jgi:hypothetical protein
VHDWLTLLDEVDGGDDADRTLLLAVLRGCLLDLLATGDVDRTTAAIHRHLAGAPATDARRADGERDDRAGTVRGTTGGT